MLLAYSHLVDSETPPGPVCGGGTMRSTWPPVMLLCAYLLWPATAAGYVQKVILAEEFSATW